MRNEERIPWGEVREVNQTPSMVFYPTLKERGLQKWVREKQR